MAIDFSVGGDGPAVIAAEVTPNDSTDLSFPARALYIGGAGDVTVHMRGNGSSVTFTNLIAGQVYPIAAQRVLSTGTTATGIVAMA